MDDKQKGLTQPNRTVLRFQKLKSWGSIAGCESHNERLRKTDNADPGRRHLNRLLVSKQPLSLETAVRSRIGDQLIRKNAVLAFEIVLSASPGYFRPDHPGLASTWREDRLEAWLDASNDWLKSEYDDLIVYSVLHLDEQTPHIQAVVVPIDPKGKLNCRHFLGGTRQRLRDLQTEYANAVKHLGIERGIMGSKAKHVSIREYYQSIANPVDLLPQIDTPDPGPEPVMPSSPGLFAGIEKKQRFERSYQQAELARAAWQKQRDLNRTQNDLRRAALEQIADNHAKLVSDHRRQAREIEQLKRENSQLLEERATLAMEATRLKGTDPKVVLDRIYGAVVARNSEQPKRTVTYRLENRVHLMLTGDNWALEQGGQTCEGSGAFALVLALEGQGPKHVMRAIRWLSLCSSPAQALADFANWARCADEPALGWVASLPIQPPDPAPEHWPALRARLAGVYGISAPLLDWAHENKHLYSDQRRHAIFPSSSGGHLKLVGEGTFESPALTRTVAKDMAPIVFEGHPEKNIVITDDPVDGLVLRDTYRKDSVIVTGAMPSLKRLLIAVRGQRHQGVVLSFSNTPDGDDLHSRIAALLEGQQMPTSVLRPHDVDPTLNSWRDIRIARHVMPPPRVQEALAAEPDNAGREADGLGDVNDLDSTPAP